MVCGPELQYITGQVFDVFVATEAQRLERGAWESRASKAYAECGVVSDGPGRTPVLGGYLHPSPLRRARLRF